MSLALADDFLSWFAAIMMVVPFVLFCIGGFFYYRRKDKRLTEQLSAHGLRRVGLLTYEGSYRGFHLVITQTGGRGIGAAGDYSSWTGYEVKVRLFNPIDGRALTPEQLDALADETSYSVDDVKLRRSGYRVEGDTLVLERTVGQFDGDTGLMESTLDGGVAAARDVLLNLTGVDVWKEDPKMLAKRDAAENLAPWEKMD